MRFLIALALIGMAVVASSASNADDILSGNFVQHRILVGFEKPLTSHGRFQLVPGRQLVWETTAPFPSRVDISASGITQTIRDNETMRLPASRFPALSLVLEIMDASLRGDWAGIEKRFNVRPVREGKTWSLRFHPESGFPEFPFQEVFLKGSEFVETVTLSRASGDRDVIEFSGVRWTGAP